MYQIRMRTFQMGSFILLFYSLLSVGSVWLYNIDSVWTFETITIFPLVYLYIVLMISFYPLLKFSNKKMSNIKMPDDMVMSMISVVVIIVYLCFFFQTILSNFSLSNLFDPMTLAENYETKSDNVGYNDGKVNIFGILKNIFNSILWILFMYNWIQKKKLLTIGVFIAIIISVFTSLAWGARGPYYASSICLFCVFSFDEPRNAEKISFYSGSFCHSHICRRSCINIGAF